MRLEKGQTIEGKITRIVDEGVFVDVGTTRKVVIPKVDVDQIKNDSGVKLKVGEIIPVYIYYAPQNGGNPLGSMAHVRGIPQNRTLKQPYTSDLWTTIEDDYALGDIVNGTVKNIKPYGAFVELPNGLEGLVHVSEMESGYTSSPWQVVQTGEEVRVRILRIEADKKRISLSLKETQSS